MRGTRKKKSKSDLLYRSGFEQKVQADLACKGIHCEYETLKLKYTVPAKERTYTPDFVLPNGIILETKGYFDAENFTKMVLVIQQHSHLDIRLVFQRPNNKIRKGSKTTYAMKCDKLGIRWGVPSDIEKWAKEPARKYT